MDLIHVGAIFVNAVMVGNLKMYLNFISEIQAFFPSSVSRNDIVLIGVIQYCIFYASGALVVLCTNHYWRRMGTLIGCILWCTGNICISQLPNLTYAQYFGISAGLITPGAGLAAWSAMSCFAHCTRNPTMTLIMCTAAPLIYIAITIDGQNTLYQTPATGIQKVALQSFLYGIVPLGISVANIWPPTATLNDTDKSQPKANKDSPWYVGGVKCQMALFMAFIASHCSSTWGNFHLEGSLASQNFVNNDVEIIQILFYLGSIAIVVVMSAFYMSWSSENGPRKRQDSSASLVHIDVPDSTVVYRWIVVIVVFSLFLMLGNISWFVLNLQIPTTGGPSRQQIDAMKSIWFFMGLGQTGMMIGIPVLIMCFCQRVKGQEWRMPIIMAIGPCISLIYLAIDQTNFYRTLIAISLGFSVAAFVFMSAAMLMFDPRETHQA